MAKNLVIVESPAKVKTHKKISWKKLRSHGIQRPCERYAKESDGI